MNELLIYFKHNLLNSARSNFWNIIMLWHILQLRIQIIYLLFETDWLLSLELGHQTRSLDGLVLLFGVSHWCLFDSGCFGFFSLFDFFSNFQLWLLNFFFIFMFFLTFMLFIFFIFFVFLLIFLNLF